MKKSYLTLFLFLFVFISCSTNKNQFLLDDYNFKDSDATISILTIELEHLYEQFPDHIFGALRPNERRIFDQQLMALFSQNTKAYVVGKLHHSVLLNVPFEKKSFNLNGRKNFKMISPKEGTYISDGNIDTKFVVIFDQFSFTSYEVEVGGGDYAGHENERESRLTFETKYLIWDNESRKPIAWGNVSSNERFNPTNKSLYSQLINNALSKIIKLSPFPNSKT